MRSIAFRKCEKVYLYDEKDLPPLVFAGLRHYCGSGSDDGIGMAPEQVAALLQNEPSDRTGIGIKNVNDRLRIYFGPGYGLSIDSVPDEGTTVTIRMPQVPADREGDYDKTR